MENIESNIQEKFKRMKYIDGEIMLMMNICLMRELDF
jgi:hypothetical protein